MSSPHAKSVNRISLRQMLAVVTCLAVILGLRESRPLLIAGIAPAALGPLVAHAISPTRGAVLVGAVSAYFVTGLVAMIAVPVLAFVHCSTGGLPVNPLRTAALLSAIVGGLLGGLLAARIDSPPSFPPRM